MSAISVDFMTRKKLDPKLLGEPFIPRPHYACRLRLDLAAWVRSECERLNCSQGVYFEVLILKSRALGLVTHADVYEYCAIERSAHQAKAGYGPQGPCKTV